MKKMLSSHEEFIKRRALKEVSKATIGKKLDREQIGSLRIQTVEPWKRVLVSFMGFMVAIFGCYLGLDGTVSSLIIGLSILIGGLLLFGLGILGRKKAIDAAIDGIDLLEIISIFT